jgi:hypothetical protein
VGANAFAVDKDQLEVGADSQFRRDERANERMRDDAVAALPPAAPPPPVAAPVELARPAQVAENAAAPPPTPIPSQQSPAAPQQMTQAQGQQQAGARQQPPPGPSAQQQVAVVAERPAAGAAGRGGGIVSGRLAADSVEALRASKAAVAAEAIAPAAAARWRVVNGRVVQRSLDAGSTWADQFSANAGVELTIGSAPSATAAWFVGRAGVVIRTADGRAWTPAKFPEQVDLVSVTATDAQSASVTTVDGRVFATTDGGATWRRR